jgi:predicted lipid-binding transport protein (Tim44 family)
VPNSSHGSGGIDSDVCWGFVAVLGAIVLVVVGWNLGRALTRGKTRPGVTAADRRAPTWSDPPRDLILGPGEVGEKARKTARLLHVLARRDSALDPSALHQSIAAMFAQVQRAWEARDYGPVGDLLTPSLRARHEQLLQAMRRERLINRIEDLAIQRLELVHVCCPEDSDEYEVTALITFAARVYFVNERREAFTRGLSKVLPYQEFWVFRRQGAQWRLHDIERSHQSKRLHAANKVGGLTDVDRRNAEEGVICL